MSNQSIPVLLRTILAIEIIIGLVFLLISGSWVTLIIIAALVGGSIGLALLISKLGGMAPDLEEWNKNMQDKQWNWSGSVGNNRRFNVVVSSNFGPERTEVVQQTVPMSAEIKSFFANVGLGSLKVTGQPELNEIQITATKRVFANDEDTALAELERLQVKHWMDGSVLRFYAGPPQGLSGTTINIGRSSRVDVEMFVPQSLMGAYTTTNGDVEITDMKNEVSGGSGKGTITVERIHSGKNLSLNNDAGKIVVKDVAVALLKAKTAAGVQELTGIGAENLDLQSNAGTIRVRGVNCGNYHAQTNAGSLEVFDANVENLLDMHANLGQVLVDNTRTAAFNLRSDSGTVNYRGYAPTLDSTLRSSLGSVNAAFAPGAAFNIEARSNLGSVVVLLPPTVLIGQSQNYFAGQIGTGGALIKATTQMGSVRIS